MLVMGICLCLLLVGLETRAQAVAYESLTIEQGLSQGMIFDLHQTRDGFLWVATKDGLNRYDGYNFKVFAHNPFDPFSLSESAVIALFEDSRGLLWISTVSKGLDVYDSRTGRFHHVPVLQARSIVETPDGSLWMSQADKELVRLTVPPTWKDRLPDAVDLAGQLSITTIPAEGFDPVREKWVSLWLREDGQLTLFSSVRQYQLALQQGIARPVSSPVPGGITGITVGAYQKGGSLWLADEYTSLYHSQNGKTSLYRSPENFKTHSMYMQEDEKGAVWMLYEKKMWQLVPGRPIDLLKPDFVLDRGATCVTADRNGNIWVGTAGYGLRKINLRRQMFHTGATGQSIWRLWQSPKGPYFWRDVSDIYPYDPVTGRAGNTSAFPTIPGDRKMDMLFEPSGSFWLLGAPERNDTKAFLLHYDANGRLRQQIPFPLNVYDYTRMMASRNGDIWILGGHCQLVRFDPRTARFDYFNYAHIFGAGAAVVQALALVEDGNGDFWIGTQRGLVKCKRNQNGFDFQLTQVDPKNPKGLNNNSIACLLPDPARPHEALWIGTKGGGINLLDLRSGQFRHLTVAEGLPDMVVYGILPGNEDPQKTRVSLWCSTNRGLAKIVLPRPESESQKPLITVFTAAKGLQDNEFNTQAYFKTAKGELLFGGVNGLNRFFPENVRSDTMPPPVFVVKMEVNHEPVDYGRPGSLLEVPLEYLRELHLGYDQNNVSFEFAALDFTDPSANRYRYRLEGLDKDWVETGTQRFAHFNHLAPGRYVFWAQGNNGEGGWQAAANAIVVVIHPPWYRSNLAYLCYFLLLVWGGWWAYQFQINRVKEREQLAYEHRETVRVKALEQLKTNFFGNVTHEFRTPLTLIMEPLRQALPSISDPKARENVRLAEQNSRKLLGLVNQLLDMAKLESGSMSLDLRHGDLVQTARDVFETFLPLAEKRGIKLSWGRSEAPAFEFDASKVELILNNLISNALKFTPEGGSVQVMVGHEASPPSAPQKPAAFIRVSDTGVGIPPEALDKIFERFFQVDPEASGRTGEGTGIGLALSKELAQLMGGSISVESAPGAGSTFTVWLPVALGAVAPKQEGGESETPLGTARTSAEPVLWRGGDKERLVVLVVEDNVELRRFIKSAIGDDCQVLEAADGEEGVKKAVDLLPDIVVSDLMMPRKDGYALCDELKNHELTAHIPIILLTAKAGVDAKIKGLRKGADDYLTKPFNTEELMARLENLVETRRRLRERFRQEAAVTDVLRPAADTVPNEALPSPQDHEFLRKFTRLVEQHLSNEVMGVEDFAVEMAISRVQLHRKLKALTDQNPTDFIRDYRLVRAYTMLKNGEGSVSDVSLATGFGNEKYFSRAFKEKYGMPPSKVS